MPQPKPDNAGFLSRWSRRKLAAARAEPAPVVPAATPHAVMRPPSAATAAATVAQPLPPVESLSFDSDFTAFLKPGVDENVQRAALRKLLRDARFNVMDGLDVYIDDYTKPSPLAAETIKDLVQARHLFAPPATRVTAEGVVEDVPEPAPAEAPASTQDAQARDAETAPVATPRDPPSNQT